MVKIVQSDLSSHENYSLLQEKSEGISLHFLSPASLVQLSSFPLARLIYRTSTLSEIEWYLGASMGCCATILKEFLAWHLLLCFLSFFAYCETCQRWPERKTGELKFTVTCLCSGQCIVATDATLSIQRHYMAFTSHTLTACRAIIIHTMIYLGFS